MEHTKKYWKPNVVTLKSSKKSTVYAFLLYYYEGNFLECKKKGVKTTNLQ